MFVMIAIAVWACALVIWWIWSRSIPSHSDLDKLKSRLLGTSKGQGSEDHAGRRAGALIHTEEEDKSCSPPSSWRTASSWEPSCRSCIEQAGMKLEPHRLVNTCLLARGGGLGAGLGLASRAVPALCLCAGAGGRRAVRCCM